MSIGTALAVLMLAAAQPATAAIITVTATGTLSSGFDQSGRFGAANTDLTGAAFSVVMTYDTTVGALGLGGPTEFIQGGIGFGGMSPGTALLTVNGVTTDPLGAQESYYRVGGTTSTADALNRITGDHVQTEGEIAINTSFAPGPRLLTARHSDCLVANSCYGSFIFDRYSFANFPGVPLTFEYVDQGSFKIDSYDVAVSGAVPEPATWATMILGLGLAGAALRRRSALAA